MEHKKTILIIEDDLAIQDVLTIIFERAGYHADVRSDGEGVLHGDYCLPDLFILDKQLSGMDGLDICKHLKTNEKSKNIPVLIISASPRLEQMVKLAGADAFQEKPFQIHDLLETVHRLIIQAQQKTDNLSTPE